MNFGGLDDGEFVICPDAKPVGELAYRTRVFYSCSINIINRIQSTQKYDYLDTTAVIDEVHLKGNSNSDCKLEE